MELYRGDLRDNFEIKPWLRSRYGIPALFFTPQIDLARLYAIHHAKTMRGIHRGCIYSAEVNNLWLYQYDFGGKSSYGPDFRNIIYTFRDFKHKAVLIKNIVDYPSKDLMRFESSDIVVVFDFSIIENLKLKETNVWQY